MPGVGKKIYVGGTPPKGLTAADRSDEDKRAIAQQSEGASTFSTPQTKANVGFNPADLQVNMPSTARYFSELGKHLDNISDLYKQSVEELKQEYSGNPVNTSIGIQEIADKVSPYYKQYKDTGYINFTPNEWINIAARYKSALKAGGESVANKLLNDEIRDRVSVNQPLIDKAFGATNTFLTSMTGSLIGTAGILKGIYDARVGNNYNENLSEWENIINSVVDNNWTRYANDIVETGAFTPEQIKKQKELGIPQYEAVQTTGQVAGTDSFVDQIFNRNTPFVAFGQAGFTTGMAVTALATDGIANAVFKGMKGAAYAARGSQVIKNLESAKKVIEGIQKQEKLFNAFVLPAISGTGEGVIEGLQTKRQVYENGMRTLEERQAEAVNNEIDRLVNTGQLIPVTQKNAEGIEETKYYNREGWEVNMNNLVDTISEKYKPYMDAAAEHLEVAASRAGIGNFLANSAINGVIAATFKAGLQAPRVRSALANTKVFGWAQNKLGYTIDEVGDKYKVTPRFGKLKSVYNVIKEPFGEFTEEYLQTLSDDTMQGWADHNFHTFVDKKYSGEAGVAIGDSFSGDWSAAWSALSNAATSQEAMKAGVMGAIGSVMGSPMLRSRGQYRGVRRNDDGSVDWKSALSVKNLPIYWRSGVATAYKEAKEDRSDAQTQAKALEDWLNDPTNREKFDGAAGTYAWAAAMDAAGKTNDEFGYRNSKLGRTINDIFMLRQAKGTQLYDSIMKSLVEAANLEEGTEEADKYIASIKNNAQVANLHEGKTDTEILNDIKKNANEMLNTMAKVEEKEKLIKNLYTDQNGHLDDDLKQSLIFSELAREDFDDRIRKLKDKLGSTTADIGAKIDENLGIENSNLTREQRAVLAEYGSFEKAWHKLETMREQRMALTKDINRLERRKGPLTKEEQLKLKSKKVARVHLAKAIKQLSEAQKSLNTVTESDGKQVTVVSNPIISASEIMAMNDIEKSAMLLQAHKKIYEVDRNGLVVGEDGRTSRPVNAHRYYSEGQQEVLDAILREGRANNENFLSDIIDLGRLQQTRQSMLEQEIAVLSDKDSFNRYVARAKRAAAKAAIKNQAKHISSIEDYQEFSMALDEAGSKLSYEDRKSLISEVEKSGNKNYERYKRSRDILKETFNFLQRDHQIGKDFNGNQLDLFVSAAMWLTNKGVDLNDPNAIYRELSKVNASTGKTEFEEYIEESNENKEDKSIPDKVFTSTDEVYNDILDLLNRVSEYMQRLEQQGVPTIVEPTSRAEIPQRPVVTQQPEPAPESLSSDTDGNPQPDPPSINGNVIVQKFSTVSGQRIGECIEEAIAEIQNADAGIYGENVEELKTDLMNRLNAAGDAQFGDEAALLRHLSTIANRLRAINRPEAYMLDRAISRIQETASTRSKKYTKLNENRFKGNPEVSSMSTINMRAVVTQHPDWPISQFIVNNGILEFIEDKLEDIVDNSEDDIEIYFFTDQSLTDATKESMTDYSHNDLPIIIAIEHESGTITGENGKKYQPIGIMPGSDNDSIRGSSHMRDIRALAQENGMVKKANGDPLTTHFSSKKNYIIATHPDINNSNDTNNDLLLLLEGENEFTSNNGIQQIADKQAENPNLSRDAAKKKTDAWNKAKKAFLERFHVKFFPGGEDYKGFSYDQSNRKGGDAGPIRIFIRKVAESRGNVINPETGQPITMLQAVKSLLSSKGSFGYEENAKNVVNFNSRTLRVADTVKKTVLAPILNKIQSNEGLDTNAKEFLNNMGKNLASALRKTMYFDHTLSIDVVDISTEDESPKYKFIIVDKDGTKVKDLAVYEVNGTPQDADLISLTADIISGLILNEQGELDEFSNRRFVTWNLDADDVLALDPKSHTTDDIRDKIGKNISEMIDDDLFYGRATHLGYVAGGVVIENPITGETTSEPDVDDRNAAPVGTTTTTTTEGSNGRPVDADSGLHIGGGQATPATSNAAANVQAIVEGIKNTSAMFELLPDQSGYRNTRTGRVYARVTSVKYGDDTAGEPFDPNSPWTTPSTAVGNIVDSIIRDFFSNNLRSTSLRTTFGRGYAARNMASSLGLTQPDTIHDVYYDKNTDTVTLSVSLEDSVLTFKVRADGNFTDVEMSYVLSENTSNETKDIIKSLKPEDYSSVLNNFVSQDSILRSKLSEKTQKELAKVGLAAFNNFEDTSEIIDESTQSELDRALANNRVKTKNLYPNITDESYNAIIEALNRQKAAWESDGWNVEANDIKAVGSIDVIGGDSGAQTIDVCGTLDLLLVRDNKEAKVVDVKTIHKTLGLSDAESEAKYKSKIEEKKPGWEIQTSLYQKFLESTGLRFIGREIMPFEVTYTDPSSTTNYIVDKDGTLKNNNIVETVTVQPRDMITDLKYVSPRIIESRLSSKDVDIMHQQQAEDYSVQRVKDAMGNIAAAMQDAESVSIGETGGQFNQYTGVEDRTTDRAGDEDLEAFLGGEVKTPSYVIPAQYTWDKLDSDVKKALAKIGFNEQSWNDSMSKEEWDRRKRCLIGQ